MEVPAPYDKSHNLNVEVETDNPRENRSRVNVISYMEENSECDFHTIILDCSPWNQVDTTGVKTLMSVSIGLPTSYFHFILHVSGKHVREINTPLKSSFIQ